MLSLVQAVLQVLHHLLQVLLHPLQVGAGVLLLLQLLSHHSRLISSKIKLVEKGETAHQDFDGRPQVLCGGDRGGHGGRGCYRCGCCCYHIIIVSREFPLRSPFPVPHQAHQDQQHPLLRPSLFPLDVLGQRPHPGMKLLISLSSHCHRLGQSTISFPLDYPRLLPGTLGNFPGCL